jgi:hypothetical protein
MIDRNTYVFTGIYWATPEPAKGESLAPSQMVTSTGTEEDADGAGGKIDDGSSAASHSLLKPLKPRFTTSTLRQ